MGQQNSHLTIIVVRSTMHYDHVYNLLSVSTSSVNSDIMVTLITIM